MSEHCYKMRCNHRREDLRAASLPQSSLCLLKSSMVLINLLGVLEPHWAQECVLDLTGRVFICSFGQSFTVSYIGSKYVVGEEKDQYSEF